MKKIMFIVFLIVFNILLAYSKVCSKDDIKIKLSNNELGIVIINNPNSKSLLLLRDNISILYILEYNDDTKLNDSISKFTKKIDYVFTKDNYDYKHDSKKLIENTIIDGITIEKDKITYLNHNFCINKSVGCDYTYLSEDVTVIDKNIKALIYDNTISESLLDGLEDDWLDTYKVNHDNYCIIILNESYEITNLIR